MSKKKYWAALGVVLMISLLTGCRLADKNKGQTSEDLLIGFFVTLDYVSSFDEQGQERGTIYGTEKGDTYEFEDLEGYGMYFKMYGDAVSAASDEEIRDLNIGGGDQFSLEGTIYVEEGKKHSMFANAVYQTSDGKVYLMPGQSGGSAEFDEYGGTLFQDMEYEPSEAFKTKYGGLTKFSYKVNMKGAPNLEQIVVKQFDKGDNVIATTVMDADSVKGQIKKVKGTSYILVEYHTKGKVVRKICEGDTIEYSHTKKDGVIVIKDIAIV